MPSLPDSLRDGVDFAAFTAEQCAALTSQVLALRDAWLPRAPPTDLGRPGMWTLGLATYLDGRLGHEQAAAGANRLLLAHFGGLYRQLCELLAGLLGRPVFTAPGTFTLPGFHIFRATAPGPVGLRHGGSIHVDGQHLQAGFDFRCDEVFSFTLPLCLPRGGGGLNFWPDAPAAEVGATLGWFDELAAPARHWLETSRRHHAYEVGRLVLHGCSTPHQIAHLVPLTPDDLRLTLQGHGVRTPDGDFLVYF